VAAERLVRLMEQGLGAFALAFGAGVVSFLSPCILPLIPAYISFVTGIAPGELIDDRYRVRDVLLPSLLFVLGFTVVFVALGASASALGAFVREYRRAFTIASGLLIVALGFFMLGVIRVPWLYGEARFDPARARQFGAGASLVVGIAFGFGWTPCVGPILASILVLAASQSDVARGAALLGVYSLGLGVPFVAVALLFGRLKSALSWLNRHSVVINRVAGVLLMVMGAMIALGWLPAVTGWIAQALPWLRFG
jgi:cytochrome c-type biogenesis protein